MEQNLNDPRVHHVLCIDNQYKNYWVCSCKSNVSSHGDSTWVLKELIRHFNEALERGEFVAFSDGVYTSEFIV
jgi:hypothetical protein